MSIVYDFRKDKIRHQRDQREVGCTLMYEDIYDAHVEQMCRQKSLLHGIFPKHLKTPPKWN